MPGAVVNEDARKEAARIARSMRRSGKTLLQISQELGVSEPTIAEWLKYRTKPAKKRKPKQRAKPRREVTPRRRVFARALIEGKNQTQAGLAAGCPTPDAANHFAQKALKSGSFQEYFNGLLDQGGLDERTLIAGLKECTTADKVVGVAINRQLGIVTDTRTHPDYKVRLEAVRTAFELRRRLHSDEDAARGQQGVHLHLTIEQKERFERLVGGPLDTDAITIAPTRETDNGNVGSLPEIGSGEPAGQPAGAEVQ